MRPIRLTLQAFGPFAGKEVVRFDQATHTGLFGIYGPTGAGKTSIFDGLCFALFGQSSGASRDGKDFRSDHADINTLTEVELVFDLGGKRYVVHRIPAQERAAKRGRSTTQQSHEAYFFDATGMAISQINDSNKGRILEEKKTSKVDKRIPEILGYSASQFRQIILLPQGQFRQILEANTKDRAAILEQLFDVSHFKRFQENLKEKAKDSIVQINNAIERRKDRLLTSGHKSVEDLRVAIETATESVNQAKLDLEKSKAAHVKSRETLETAKAINARFDELTKLQTELRELQTHQPEIDSLKLQLDSANRAKSLIGLETALSQSKLDHQQAISRLEAAKQQETAAIASHKQALSTLEALQQQAPSIKQAEIDLQRLLNLQDISASNLVYKTELETKSIELKQHTEAHQTLLKAFKTTQEKLANQREEAGQALHREKEILKYEKTLEVLQIELKALQTYATAYSDYNKQNQLLEAATTQHSAAVSALKFAQDDFNKAQSDLSHIQAIHLAATLKNGDNCPVCGSQDHPRLATGDRSSKGLNEAFENAKKSLEKANTSERSTSEILIAQREKTLSAQKILAGLPNPTSEQAQLESQQKECVATIKKLNALVSHKDITQLIQQSELVLENQTRDIENSSISLQKVKSAYDVATSRFEDTLQKLPIEYRDASVLAQEISISQKTIENFKQNIEKAQENERISASNLGNIKTSIKEKCETLDRILKRLNREQSNFDAALIDAGFNAESLLSAKAVLLSADDYMQKIEAHTTAKISVQARITQTSEATKDTQIQDITTLKAELATAETILNTQAEACSTIQHVLENLATSLKLYLEADKEVDRLNAEFGPLGGLAELIDGKNPYKLKLADFAIAAMYDDVLDAANLRLVPMTSGRFELRRDTSTPTGNGSQGLDTLVFDTHTQTLRPATSLSGGEGFIASLALALGLSDIVQEQAGGVRLESLFIDEGFGTLGSETLDLALETLQELASNNRLVGIISHVEDVKRAIPNGFLIEKSRNGSHISQSNVGI